MSIVAGPSYEAYSAWPGHQQQAAIGGFGMPFNPAVPGFVPGVGYGNGSIVDKLPSDMLYMIDAHWYQFPAINPLMNSLLGFVIGLMGVISVIGNFVVMWIFLTTRSLKTPSNLLVINLAFSDFCMMFLMFPPMVVNCYHETWVWGPFMCELYGMTGSLFGCASIWTLAMISMDRYNTIVKGLAAKPMTYKRALGMILFVWLMSLIWTLAPFLGWGRYVPEGNMTVCGLDSLADDWIERSYVMVYAVWCYFIPLLVIIYCYFNIVQAVAEHEQTMRDQARKMNVQSLRSSDGNTQSAEIRLAKIALITISLWFLAWTPYLVININGMFNKQRVTPLFTIWGSLFAKLAAVYNPIVYGISHPKYRAALEKKIPCLACKSADDDDDDTKSRGTIATTAVHPIEEKPTA